MTTSNPCEAFELLMQADIDGELSAAEAAALTTHRNNCMHCMVRYKELLSLRERVRGSQYYSASDGFRARMQATLAAARKSPAPLPEQTPDPVPVVPARPVLVNVTPEPRAARRPWWRDAGGTLAACLLLSPLLRPAAAPDLAGEVVAGHIRAMQANHLMDVASNDQHNVKPWFEGKVDFAPPVKNLAAQGFPLAGGRLDYVNQRNVAVMIYQGGKHPINLFAWPDAAANSGPGFSTVQGYNMAHWTQGGMSLWAISDMNMAALVQFTADWRAQ